MSNVLIFDPNSTPVSNRPVQYFVSQNTVDFIGRTNVLFNPILPDGWTFQNSKVLGNGLVFLTAFESGLISGYAASGAQSAASGLASGDISKAKELFALPTHVGAQARALYAFNILTFKAINSLREYMGLDTYSNNQLMTAINNELDGQAVSLSDTGKVGAFYPADNPDNFATVNQLQNGSNTLNNKINNLSGYVEATFVKI